MSEVVTPVALASGVGAWFTGRSAGNLAHRRPHLPSRLARARRRVAEEAGLGPLHLMAQVHGAEVGVVDASTVPGAELRGVDALVTAEPGRAVAVQVADCVPLLLAADGGPVAAVHVGRRGLLAGVTERAVAALAPESGPVRLRAAVGPAIGGCCYEVPAAMRAEVAAAHPQTEATTTWGTPALDLPAGVRAVLDRLGVEVAADTPGCTRCDPGERWFSHRADPAAGRQLGIVVMEDGP